jgi:ketosteroid isomerase-like protein
VNRETATFGVSSGPLDRETVDRWLDRHDAAWASGDAAAIGDLFTADGVYHLGPWEGPWHGMHGPLVGREAIAAGWQAAAEPDERFEIETDPLAIDGSRAIVRRRITYMRPDGTVDSRYDTAWLLDFAADGRVREYQEWFVEEPRDDGG